jgi:NAD(P)-dependent dehydrogenase (short-subunit alcohol dehydrogenase family)
MMRIAVVDGQGGGIGRTIVEKLKQADLPNLTVVGLGTNSEATAQMLRAGADEAATGENAIVFNASKVDVIVGVLGILSANAMLGELTPAMAAAIGASPAQKILLPVNRCGIQVIGIVEKNLTAYIDEAIEAVRSIA